jgi:prophage antirepressor-like protein
MKYMNKPIEISEVFNNWPIRIIGTLNRPFFYAADIAQVLNIKNIRKTLKNYSDKELVTPEVRKELNIVTYRQYKDELRRDDTIILLTEMGMYKLIITSRSPVADQLRDHLYEILCAKRLSESTKLNVISQEDYDALSERVKKLESDNKFYESQLNFGYVFRRQICGKIGDYMRPKDVDMELRNNVYNGFLYLITKKIDDYDRRSFEPYGRIVGDDSLFEKLYGDSVDDRRFIDVSEDVIGSRFYYVVKDLREFLEIFDSYDDVRFIDDEG